MNNNIENTHQSPIGRGTTIITGGAYQLLHSRLMTHGIHIGLRLAGESRLIFNSISSSAMVVTEWYEISEQSLRHCKPAKEKEFTRK